MEHYFELPVHYNGDGFNLKARLVTFGYVYKFYVIVEGKELVFEKDNEQNYRVISERGNADNKSINGELLEAIVKSLQNIEKK